MSFFQLAYLAALLGLLMLTATLAWQFARRERQWKADLKRLADIKYAIDQAAIVATTDVKGRITYVNDKFCEISGYPRDELLGQDHRIVNSGLHPPAFMRNLWRTIASGRVWHGELRNRARDGHYYWVDTTIVPFLDERGKPYQYTAIRSDITQRKAAEERLREQAALARVGQMAAMVAHEVKNPLAGIKGVIQVLMARRQPQDAELPVMGDVVQRIDALNELIQDLLLFARPRPLRVQPFHLPDVLQQTAAIVQRDPAAGRLTVTIDGDPVQMFGDAELLKAAFLNVMLNAVHAMQGHGRLTVRTALEEARCRIDISDSGPGIPRELLPQVFEPFFTTKSRGGGLGLPIARRTIELHGGSMALVCPTAGGTSVHIELPLRPPVTQVAETADSAA